MAKLGSLLMKSLLWLVGAIAIALIVWFAGPLLAFADYRPLETARARGIAIALILVLWLGRRLVGAMARALSNRKLLDALAPAARPDADAQTSEEQRVVRERFATALGIMRQSGASGDKPSWWSRLSGNSRFVYQLPWYVFIGPPGSGKTTALLNSGLQFPLANRIGDQPVRGVAGTRHCDWWFTDQAVLIDTAGRYVTQDSDAATDATEWREFMALLRRHRPRQPINGALVTISIGDLLQMTATEQAEQAQAVRARVQELLKTLDTRFPVYLLVTKVDLLPGFVEFFDDLPREAREQVWGSTFDYDDRQPAALSIDAVAQRFDDLVGRVTAMLADRLAAERDLNRRTAMYAFVHHLATIRQPLIDFIGQAFPSADMQNAKAIVRGFYLTSGTQEGTPIDRALGALGRRFGLSRQLLPPSRAAAKSFFLTRLLRDVVFPEAPIAGTNLKHVRRKARLKWAGMTAAIVLAGTAIAGWTTSYFANAAYVDAVDANARELKAIMTGAAAPKDIKALLPLYRTLASLARTDDVDPRDARLLQGLGLFQGPKLEAAAQQSYHRLLAQTLAPALGQRLASVLRQGAANPELQYEALKTYAMLASPGNLDRDAVKGWVAFDLESNRAADLDAGQRAELLGHLDALLARNAVHEYVDIDRAVLASTRAALGATPFPARVYQRLSRRNIGREFPEFRIDKAGGASAALVIQRRSGRPLSDGVPGLYTYDGYHKGFVKAAESVIDDLASEEVWVLGIADSANARRAKDRQSRESLVDEVKRLYLRDYATTWENFVADIGVIPGSSLVQTIQTARILSEADSPLVRLLKAIVREVSLTEVEGKPASSLLEKANEKVLGTRQQLEELLGRQGGARPAAAATRIESIVDDRFEALRTFVRPGPGGTPPPIDKTTALIAEIYQLMSATETAVKSGAAAPASSVPDRVKAEAARMPDPIRSMVRDLAAAGAGQALGATRQTLDQELTASVTDACVSALANRYPFTRGSAIDVTAEDFARLFGPNGILDDFFQKKLAPHVDTSVKPWRFRRVGDASLGASASLIQFQHAAEIRSAFFAGGPTPSVRLSMKPVQMDPALLQFNLDADGQILRYAHGPSQPTPIRWPGPGGTNQIRLQVSPGGGGQLYEGPWAIFRMFDRAQLQPAGPPERFNATFQMDGRPILFEVTTSSVQNPFRLPALAAFQCPRRL